MFLPIPTKGQRSAVVFWFADGRCWTVVQECGPWNL